MKLSIIALGLITGLTPALANAGEVYERFAESEFYSVRNSVTAQLGKPTTTVNYRSCYATNCDNTAVFWIQPGVFAVVQKAIDHGEGFVQIGENCPRVYEKICARYGG